MVEPRCWKLLERKEVGFEVYIEMMGIQDVFPVSSLEHSSMHGCLESLDIALNRVYGFKDRLGVSWHESRDHLLLK